MKSSEMVEADVAAALAAICQCDPAEVRTNGDIDALGLGSVGMIAVISRIEAIYQVELDPEQMLSLIQVRFVEELAGKARELVDECRRQREQ